MVALTGWSRWRGVLILLGVAITLVVAHQLGLGRLVRLDDVRGFREWIGQFGPSAPLVYIVGYVVAELLFVPALPLTILGGVAFGPLLGTAYVSVASTLAAALAFLVARYVARGLVEGWVTRSPRLARIDRAVAEHGWRILVVTRLVPLFPFNLQNFAYGLTRIHFRTFVLLSWLCMLPGTAAYTLAAGALADGQGDPRRTIVYLALAGVLIVAVSLLPRYLTRRSRVAGELAAAP